MKENLSFTKFLENIMRLRASRDSKLGPTTWPTESVQFAFEVTLDLMEMIGEILRSSILIERLVRASSKSLQAKVVQPPGTMLVSTLSFFYSKKKYKSLIEQAIADMREEYFEALAAGQHKKAGWIRLRGTYSVWAAVFMDVPVSLTRLVTKIWKASQ